MSGVAFNVNTPEIASTTSARTILQVVAANHHRIKIREFSVSFKGTSNTASPVLVEVLRQSTAGTMTSLAPVKGVSTDDETLQTTAQHTATVEPTAGDVLHRELVHPQQGFLWQSRVGSEVVVAGGGRVGIRVTAGSDVNVVACMRGDE